MAPSKSRVALAALVLGTVLGQAPLGADAIPVKIVGKTAECVDALNLARMGRLDKKVGKVDNDKASEESAVAALTKDLYQSSLTESCAPAAGKNPKDFTGLLIQTEHKKGDAEDPVDSTTCPKMIQAVIKNGLTAVTSEKAKDAFNTEKGTYADANAQNFAYLLWSDATKVACVATQGCTGGTNALYCKFDKQPATTGPAFTEDFYKAVKARSDANVTVDGMKPDDMNKPLTSSVSAIVPSALVMGATALLGIASL